MVYKYYKQAKRAAAKAWKQTPRSAKLTLARKAIDKGISMANKHYRKYKRRTNQRTRKGRESFKSGASSHNDINVMNVPNSLKPGKLKDTEGYYTYKVTKQKIVSKPAGIQLVDNGYAIAIKTQFNGTTTTSPSLSNFPDDVFLLNPYQTPELNAIYTGVTPATSFTGVIGLDSVAHEITIVNMESSGMEVTVMWMLCTNDTVQSPTTLWNESVLAANQNQGGAAIRSTFAASSVGFGAESFESYGALPSHAKLLNKYFKTIAKSNFTLQGGDQKRMCLKFNHKKFISRQVVLNEPTKIWMAGYSIHPVIICKGAVVGLATDANTASAEVTYASCRIGLLQTDTYKFASLPPGIGERRNRRVEGQIINPSDLVEKIINDEDDATVVEVQ